MKFLHTMLRVTNLDKSIAFYCDVLGMKLQSRNDYPGGRFTLAFLACDLAGEQGLLELTHNWDTNAYDLGAGFGHIAIGVDDVYAACDRIRDQGGRVVREPGPMQHGSTVLAFIEDPDGYKIELLNE